LMNEPPPPTDLFHWVQTKDDKYTIEILPMPTVSPYFIGHDVFLYFLYIRFSNKQRWVRFRIQLITLMRIRIQLITLMRIRIRIIPFNLMQIHWHKGSMAHKSPSLSRL
jgi:hypothetical protein